MTKHGTILLIEDEANDASLTRKALVEAGVTNPVQTVNSYEDAVKYLTGEGMYANRAAFPVPFLVLLDLNIPAEGGFGVLRWLYERPGLRKTFSVLALSGSGPAQEIQLAYELGAQSFLLKPLDYQQLAVTIRKIKEYWVDLNLLPQDKP